MHSYCLCQPFAIWISHDKIYLGCLWTCSMHIWQNESVHKIIQNSQLRTSEFASIRLIIQIVRPLFRFRCSICCMFLNSHCVADSCTWQDIACCQCRFDMFNFHFCPPSTPCGGHFVPSLCQQSSLQFDVHMPSPAIESGRPREIPQCWMKKGTRWRLRNRNTNCVDCSVCLQFTVFMATCTTQCEL